MGEKLAAGVGGFGVGGAERPGPARPGALAASAWEARIDTCRCKSNQALFVLLVVTTCLCGPVDDRCPVSRQSNRWLVWGSPPLPILLHRVAAAPRRLSFLLFPTIILSKDRNKRQIYTVTGIM